MVSVKVQTMFNNNSKIEWYSWMSMAYFIAPVLIIVSFGPGYELTYEGMAAEPQALTVWSLEQYQYTLAFLLAIAPLIVLARSNKSEKALRITLISINTVLIICYAFWLFIMWFGIMHPMNILNSVAP